MPRTQVESGVRQEALQTVGMPKAQAVTPRFDPNESQAYQLASALGAAGPTIDKIREKALDAEQEDARRFAQSITPDELRKKIDSGEIPMWKSPLWAATVRHVSGDNAAKAIFREVESKIAMDEFKTQKQLDDFIIQRRNEFLSGKDAYEVAGFDKNFGVLRERAANQQNVVYTKRLETEGLAVASEGLANVTAEVTSPSFDGKPNSERVAKVIQHYSMHRTARTLSDDASRKALDGVLLKLADAGHKDLVDEFLKTQLPNNGPTVEAFLTSQRSVQLRNVAEREWNRVQTENARRAVEAEVTIITNEANAQADELVAQQNGASMPDKTVPTFGGGTKVIKGTDFVEAAIARRIAANPEMDFESQVRLYKNNGIINQAWKKNFSTAVYNLGEINIDTSGKPSGKLLKPTIEALEQFAIARQVSEQYAKDLVGEDNYKILNKVQALREAGIPDLTMAAGVVNQINRRQYEPKTWGAIKKDVGTAIEEIKSPGFLTGRFWGDLFRGEFGDASKNIIPIEGNIAELAEAYLQARIAPDGKAAVKMATEWMSKSVVQVNNTLYMKSDLPRVPQGENEIEWFERYQKEVLIPRLNAMGIKPSVSDLTLLPTKGGQASYVVANRAMPIPDPSGGSVEVTRDEVEKWVQGAIETRLTWLTTTSQNNLRAKQGSKNPAADYANPADILGFSPGDTIDKVKGGARRAGKSLDVLDKFNRP